MIGKNIMTITLIGGLPQKKISKECRRHHNNKAPRVTQQNPLLAPCNLLS